MIRTENMEEYVKLIEARSLIEKTYEYDKWKQEIPFINFPSDWGVKIIPTFTGAVVRFLVNMKDSDSSISVYLDCYDELGCFGEPYWEIYPYKDGMFLDVQ